MIKNFKYNSPSQIQELLEIYNEFSDKAKLVAGGTELVVNMREQAVEPEYLIDLTNISALKNIKEDNNYISIGSACTHNQITSSKLLQDKIPWLVEGSSWVGVKQTRNMGTIGGNISASVPCADTAPPLLVSEAEFILKTAEEDRKVDAVDFFTGPRENILRSNEVLTEILIPKKEGSWHGKFEKIGGRKVLTLAIVNSAILIKIDNNQIEDVKIALGSVAPTPIRAYKTEDRLRDLKLSLNKIIEALENLPDEASPITDIRASKEYRKKMIKVLTYRAFKRIIEEVAT